MFCGYIFYVIEAKSQAKSAPLGIFSGFSKICGEYFYDLKNTRKTFKKLFKTVVRGLALTA